MMRDLFSMDMKDYDPSGEVFSRPSARAIIIHDDKVLMVHSAKYDYYKFPGGGIEKEESPVEALIREVKEETGYQIIKESVKEYGRVLRRQKDTMKENCIFEQENLYYWCEIENIAAEQKLDDYEKEEGFTPVWVLPFPISKHNAYLRNPEIDRLLVKRESKVLDLVDLEIRKQKRKEQEVQFLAELGEADYADMLAFVERELNSSSSEQSGAKVDISYDRFEHTKRVLAWAKRLYDLSPFKEELRFEDIMIATIFHDVGRSKADATGESHAKAGMPIAGEYLRSHGFDEERCEFICHLIGEHSDKWKMKEENLDKNSLLLMEADLMDDMGAQGIVMDCMITQVRNPKAQFTDCLDHIKRYTYRIQQDNPMVTPEARKIWDDKTRLVKEFLKNLESDLTFK